MSKANFGQSHREQEKMAGKVDKSIKRDAEKSLGRTDWSKVLREQEEEMFRVKSFKEIYPTFALWERKIHEKLNVDSAVHELTEFGDFPKKPRAVRNWMENELYENDVLPNKAIEIIKERLCW